MITNALNGSSLRGELIANNIANVSTPDYKRQDVDFKSALNRELKAGSRGSGLRLETTSSSHLSGSRSRNGRKITENSNSSRNDGNSVDIEVEMAEMAKNSIYYNVMSDRAAAHFSNLNRVIQEGSK
jgi:flagellar basal-body rod protein FlgB